MDSSESESPIVLELAEEFLDRYRQGQRPALKEYIDRHPELAGEICEVFPAIAMIENIAIRDESLDGDPNEYAPRPVAAARLKQLGDYRIIREIGHGGMGVVYEAEQVSLGRHVALKVLPPSMVRGVRQLVRVRREVGKAAGYLHHTNIVPVFGVGEQDGTAYYVMQFIAGLGLDLMAPRRCVEGVMKTKAELKPGSSPLAGEGRGGTPSFTPGRSAASAALTGGRKWAATSSRPPPPLTHTLPTSTYLSLPTPPPPSTTYLPSSLQTSTQLSNSQSHSPLPTSPLLFAPDGTVLGRSMTAAPRTRPRPGRGPRGQARAAPPSTGRLAVSAGGWRRLRSCNTIVPKRDRL